MASQHNVPVASPKKTKLPTKTTKVGDTTFVSTTPYYETEEGKAVRKEQKKAMNKDMYSTPDGPVHRGGTTPPPKVTKKAKTKKKTSKLKKRK